MFPAANLSRKRTHSTSDSSSTQIDNYKAPDFPAMYIKDADGNEEIDPDAYLARGFGWVGPEHPTMQPWYEFVETLKKRRVEERKIERQPDAEFLKKLDAMHPGWRADGFSVRSRSRSNSRSRNSSPIRSPVRRHEEDEEPSESDADLSYISSPESPLSPDQSPVKSPIRPLCHEDILDEEEFPQDS